MTLRLEYRTTTKIILPALVAIVAFSSVLFGVILPQYRTSLFEGKKQLVREVSRSAWAFLADLEAKERRGELNRAAAQAMAIDHIRALRYGEENKDYLWINDMQPVLVMHPYRTDLEGQYIGEFLDPNGFPLFQAFVDTVRDTGEGYVSYQWQWKDDPTRIVPKLSFVKGFAPWGWVIGTGIYLDDVHREIAAVTRQAVALSLFAVALAAGLAVFLATQAIRSSRLQRQAEEELRAHQAHLEEQVAHRTADLAAANNRLQNEVRERREAERTVRGQHTFLHSIIESLPHPFYVVDVADFRITLANSAAGPEFTKENSTCYALSHGRDTPCHDTDHSCPLETVRKTGKPTVIEHVHRDGEGRESVVELHAYPVFGEKGEVVQMIEYAIDITARKAEEQERERLIAELQDALDKIRTLRGMIPICCFCKQIRDDKGYWQQVENYVSEHSGAEFTHGVCPECLEKHYADLLEEGDVPEPPPAAPEGQDSSRARREA